MSRKDIIIISTIASVVALITYFTAVNYFSKATLQSSKIKTFESVSPNITKPDSAVFNKNAINPSVQVLLPTNLNGQ